MLVRLSPSACLIALAIVVLVGAAVVWAIGSKLIAVETRPVALPGLGAEDVVLRPAPDQRIGVIAVSLGAASLVLCRDCPPIDAVVLEAMYPTIEEAVANRLRMRIGPAGGPLSALLLWQLPLRLDIRPDALRPIAHIGKLKAPVLIAAGGADLHTTLPETQRLFAAAAQPKDLWVVEGAAHVDLHAYAPADYERRIGAFLARHLASMPVADER